MKRFWIGSLAACAALCISCATTAPARTADAAGSAEAVPAVSLGSTYRGYASWQLSSGDMFDYVEYTFADGTYVRSVYHDAEYTEASWEDEGTYTLSGNTLTLFPYSEPAGSGYPLTSADEGTSWQMKIPNPDTRNEGTIEFFFEQVD